MVYINDVRRIMARIDRNEHFIKKLKKKENYGFKGYEITVYKPNIFQNKSIMKDLSRLGLIFVSKRTNKTPYCEVYTFNY